MVFDGKAFLPLLLLSSSLLSARAETPLPDAIAAPGEATVLYRARRKARRSTNAGPARRQSQRGRFAKPIATLLVDGKTIGRHYSGPNWEHSDGSAVVGKAPATPRARHRTIFPGSSSE